MRGVQSFYLHKFITTGLLGGIHIVNYCIRINLFL